MRLATLEGNSVRVRRRTRPSPYSEAMSAFSGYGHEPETLGGVKSFLKRKARQTGNIVSQGTRATVPVIRKVGSVVNTGLRETARSDIPGVSQLAKGALVVTSTAESAVRQINDATTSSSVPAEVVSVAKSPKTWIILGVLGIGGFFLFGKKRGK